MRTSRALAIVVALAAAGGCTQALQFNFGFTGSDDGDMVKPLDQSVADLASTDLASAGDLAGAGDLAMSLDLPMSVDLAMTVDLHGAKGDLRASTGDLATPDLRQADLAAPDLIKADLLEPSRLGTACNPSDLNPCGLGFVYSCLTQFETANGVVSIANGYCTLACDKDDLCTPYGGACRQLGKSGTFCMPTCSGACARDDEACCAYCPDVSSCITGTVCPPPSAPDFNQCLING